MKKLLVMLLVLAMVLGTCACGGPEYDEALLGLYTCYEVEMLDVRMIPTDVWADECTIELKQGGKGNMHIDGEDASLKFTLAGEGIEIEVDGETGTGTLVDGILVIELVGMTLSFTQEGVDPPAAGDVGYFKISMASADGTTMEGEALAAVGLDQSYLILNEDGTGAMFFEEYIELEWTPGVLTAEGESLIYTLDGDVIHIDLGGVAIEFTRSDDAPPAAPPAEEQAPAEEAPAEEETTGAPTGAAFEPVTATLGEYQISVVAAEHFEDTDGEPAIRVYYDFTNNSTVLAAAWSDIDIYAYQDDYELVGTYASFEDDVPEYGNDDLVILPGCTIRCIEEFSYKPDGGEVTFEFEEWYTYETMTATFDAQNLPGRPEALTFVPIAEPNWTEGLGTEGIFEGMYHYSITGYEYADGYDGTTVLRVYLDFTNNGDTDVSFWAKSNYYALQDGIQLPSAYAATEVEGDNMELEIVAPGESIVCALVFEVRSDSPIEFLIEDAWEGAVSLGMLIPAA